MKRVAGQSRRSELSCRVSDNSRVLSGQALNEVRFTSRSRHPHGRRAIGEPADFFCRREEQAVVIASALISAPPDVSKRKTRSPN